MEVDKEIQSDTMVDTIEGMQQVILSQIELVNECLDLLVMNKKGISTLQSGRPEVLRVIAPMIHMAGISGHSLLKLTEGIELGVRDAFPIVRSIVEGVINICYIMSAGPAAAEKADRHAEVKAYRDLKRQWAVAGMKVDIKYSGKLSAEDVSRLELMLPEFTTSKGREKDWTDHSLKQKLEVISKKFPSKAMIMLNGSAFNIYSHASEVVHGTYFSACYFWGLTLPGRPRPSSPEDVKRTLLGHKFSLLVSTAFAYMGLLECFSDYVEESNIAEKSRIQYEFIRALPAIADEISNPSSYSAKFTRP